MELILDSSKDHPSCPHGPCLMFERRSSNGKKTGRRFYACSACRDRSKCNFFQWVDDNPSPQSKEHWKNLIEKAKPPYSHQEYMKRLTKFKSCPPGERKYCKTCSLLVLPGEKHENHSIINISLQNLLQPSLLFGSLENKKAEAQYFFSEKNTHFIVTLLKSLGFSKLLLIGVPKVHEYVAVKESANKELSSFLMDVDFRYMQFFDPGSFCHYNMFNNHFFGGKHSEKKAKSFLAEHNTEKVIILIDPPFGGLVDAISHTLRTINNWWQAKNSKEESEQIPILWFFPYFMEGRILKNFPNMLMMDYKVGYANHKKFKNDIKCNSSPVRIFTNVEASSFVLPSEEGYRYCTECRRYVSEENKHCKKCNACTTKHGKTYHHCDHCQKCVKYSYEHCADCNTCCLMYSDGILPKCESCRLKQKCSDKKISEICFKCGGVGHRKRDCKHFLGNPKKKRRKLK